MVVNMVASRQAGVPLQDTAQMLDVVQVLVPIKLQAITRPTSL